MKDLIISKINGGIINLQNRDMSSLSMITKAEQRQALNGEDVVNITVESAVKIPFLIGDTATIYGRVYKINRLPVAKKTGKRLFTYDIEMEGVQYDLMRATYDLTIDTTNNELQDLQADTLTGNLERFATVLISNANRVFPGKWELGELPADTEDKTLVFGENDNCLSVAQRLCEEYGLEYDIEQSGGVNVLNFRKAGQIFPFTFEYGKGKGLYSLERQNVSSANIVTRLKVYGSTRNITTKYRAQRLCLPGKTKGQSYIEKADAVAKFGIWEATKNFDDIFPSRTGKVTAVVAGSVLKFVDNTMNFDLNEKESDGITTKYLLPGLPAKIHFKSGNLSGYDFELQSYDHATKTFTLKPFKDERGDTFPSERSSAFQFSANDEYTILDIALPQSYIDAAEADLAAKGDEYYDQNSQPKVQYSLEVAEEFLKEFVGSGSTVNIFNVGDYIPVKDDDIEVDKSVRIQGFTRDLIDEYKYQLTLSDTVTTSITNRVISDLIDIDKVIKINNLKDPARARRNWRSAQELLDMIFDVEGDYYSDKIKPGSIETQMLSVGAKSTQLGLIGTVIQANYNGNKNSVNVRGGILSHYSLDRVWNLANSTATLTGDGTPYYIYAKCQRAGTAGSIIFSTNQIKVEQDPDFYHFFVGVINSVDPGLNVRSVALTYGFTTVNGRFIRTGRIESADGTTYFDLDLGEIGGKIKFKSNGVETDLEEWAQGADTGIQEAKDIASDVQTAIDDLDEYVDGAFKDGVISSAEAKAIEKYKNSLNEIMSKAEASYNKVYANPYLEGTPKTNLLNAKINLWGQRDTLMSAINTAIAGGSTTTAQKTAVDNAFNTFNSRMSAYQNALEDANKAIQNKIKGFADNAQEAADNAASIAADAQAKANKSAAVTDKFATTIDGGLIGTVMILLRELNSLQETAGLSGIQGELKNNPAFWSGGTYAQALALIQFLSKMSAGSTPSSGEYENLAKIVLLHDGAAKVGDFIIEETGRIVMVNPSTGQPRLVFSIQNIPDINDLVNSTTGSGTAYNSARTLSGNSEFTLANKITVSKDSSTITFKAGYLSITVMPSSQATYAWGSISATLLRDGKPYAMLGEVGAEAIGGSNNASRAIDRTITGCPAGTYSVLLSLSQQSDSGEDIPFANGGISNSTLSWSFTQTGIRRLEFGLNGLMAYYSDRHLYFSESRGLDVKGATNMPGVLVSGRVAANGSLQYSWKISKLPTLGAQRTSAGKYRITHNIGNTNYSFVATPIGQDVVCVVESISANYVTMRCYHVNAYIIMDCAFSFTITGDNY